MDEAKIAAQIWEDSKPHAPATFLAFCARHNLPFPYTGLPAVAPGLLEFLAASGWEVERYGYEYLRFRCPVCRTSIFEPATRLGIDHIRTIAQRIHPAGCSSRAALNRETIWPDSLGG